MADHIVGLDIGTFTAKVVEMEMGRSGSKVLRAGQITLPTGAVVAGEVVDAVAVSQAVSRLLKVTNIKTKKCVIGVAGPQVVVRISDFPTMSEVELRTALAFEIVELLPIPESDLVSDYEIQERLISEQEPERIRVLVAGASQRTVHASMEAARLAGLSVVGVDLNAAAMTRGLAYVNNLALGGETSTEVTPDDIDIASEDAFEAIVDVGAGVTTVTVFSKGRLRFVRMLQMGGDSATLSIADRASLEFDAAEGLKRAYPSPLEDQRVGLIVSQAVEAAVLNLVTEISSTIEYFQLQNSSLVIEKIWMTGGSSVLPGLEEGLSQRLGVSVVHPSVVEYLGENLVMDEGELESLARGFLTCLGLGAWAAVESAKGTKSKINLLPKSISEQAQATRQLVGIGGVLLLAVVALGAAWFAEHSKESSLNTQLAQDNAAVAQTQTQITKMSYVATLLSQIQSGKTYLNQAATGTVSWPQVLINIGNNTPADVWLGSFSASIAPTGASTATFSLSGCSQESPKNWLNSISAVQFLTNTWVSSSTLTPSVQGGQTCPSVPASGPLALQVGLTAFSSTSNFVSGFQSNRASAYLGGSGS